MSRASRLDTTGTALMFEGCCTRVSMCWTLPTWARRRVYLTRHSSPASEPASSTEIFQGLSLWEVPRLWIVSPRGRFPHGYHQNVYSNRLRSFLTGKRRKEIVFPLLLDARRPKASFPSPPSGPYCLEGATLASRLAESRNYKHPCYTLRQ